VRVGLIATAVVASFFLFGLATQVNAAPVTNKPIQPGAPLGWGYPAWCTQGFIFRDTAGTWYGSTAAHCYNVGDFVINTQAGDWFGQVVVSDATIDFALFKIFSDKVALVSPSVRHWGGPTGTATPADVQVNDRVAIFGYPLGTGDGYPVANANLNYAEGRLGLARGISNGLALYTGPDINGDSGGPLLLHKNGLAFGLVAATHINSDDLANPALDEGPSIQTAISRMAAAGYSLTLQTAPFYPVPL